MKINLVEMYAGLGTLTDPLVRGLSRIATVRVVAGLEMNPRYLAEFSKLHPEASTATGDVTRYAPEELSFARPDGINIFVAGIPCTGASNAGKSKLGLAAAEEHEHVGHLFIPTLHHILRHRPGIVVFENVPPYATSYSADRIRQTLRKAGYEICERIVNPFTEFNTPTERRRWVMVASRIGRFDWNFEKVPFTGTLGQFLDAPSARDAEDESTPAQVAADTKFLSRKKAEGCGFAMRIIDADSKKCFTIPRTYGKAQPSGTRVKTANSYRMLRPTEVARLHRHSAKITEAIERLPATLAYEVLGQGVVAPPFENLGEQIARFATGQSVTASVGQTAFAFAA